MLLHLSFDSNLPTTLQPQQPAGYESSDRTHITFEDLPPRVSFAPTIGQCWMAIYKNISQYFDRDNYPYMDMYVYAYDGTVKSIGNVIPESIMAAKVHDWHMTKEVAFTKPVRIRKVGRVRFWNRLNPAERIDYVPFNNKQYPKRLLCMSPLYFILEQYDRSITLESTGVHLYHYSQNQHINLATKRSYTTDADIVKRAESMAKNVGDIGSYLDHISFFIEPIPTDILPKLFEDKHPFYRSNTTVVEHIVEVTKDASLKWALQETPEINSFSDRWDWTSPTVEQRRGYIRRINQEMTKLDLQGTDVNLMFKAIRPFLGTTRDYFIKARKSKWANDTATQYAAEVPHLMLYPKSGTMPVLQSREVKFGVADVLAESGRLLWRKTNR